jgi:hypothetical protein
MKVGDKTYSAREDKKNEDVKKIDELGEKRQRETDR